MSLGIFDVDSAGLGGSPTVGVDYAMIQRTLQTRLSGLASGQKMVGLLFGRPQVELVKEQIIPNSSYWHYRSGETIDFFCIGFSSSPLVEWDPKKFTETLDRFEAETSWKYSGGTDLILLNARLKGDSAVLDASTAIVITLEVAIANNVIIDVSQFFETLIRDAKRFNSADAASNARGKELIWEGIKSLLISLLPEPLRDEAKKAFSYVVRDISKS